MSSTNETVSPSDEPLVYTFYKRNGEDGPASESDQCVVFDPRSRVVRFQNCHTLRKFLAVSSQPLVTCRFDDILAVYRNPSREFLWIYVITPTGTGKFPNKVGSEDLFEKLYDQLRILAPNDLRAPAEAHPLMSPITIISGFMGMIAMLALMPKESDTALMCVAGFAGIVSGIFGCVWGVRFADRQLGLKLVLPIGMGLIGAFIGLVLFFKVVCSLTTGNGFHLSALLIVGFFAGLMIGVIREKRKSVVKQSASADK